MCLERRRHPITARGNGEQGSALLIGPGRGHMLKPFFGGNHRRTRSRLAANRHHDVELRLRTGRLVQRRTAGILDEDVSAGIEAQARHDSRAPELAHSSTLEHVSQRLQACFIGS